MKSLPQTLVLEHEVPGYATYLSGCVTISWQGLSEGSELLERRSWGLDPALLRLNLSDS